MGLVANKVVVTVGLTLGTGLWLFNAKNLNDQGLLDYTPNVATLKASPYGKILALAMQGPIDFYWHEGQTHADAHVHRAGEEGHHDHSSDVDSDHSSDEDLADIRLAKLEARRNLAWHIRAKRKVAELTAFTHRKTNGGRLTKEHALYLQTATEDKLRFAYELDPSNYTNYGNYQLFLSNSNIGRNFIDEARHFSLSKQTLAFCKKDSKDPASSVTAAMAAYDMAYHMAGKPNEYNLSEVRLALGEFDFCMQRYIKIFEGYSASEIPFSAVRADELKEHARYLTALRKAFDGYIKRLSSDRGGGEIAK